MVIKVAIEVAHAVQLINMMQLINMLNNVIVHVQQTYIKSVI